MQDEEAFRQIAHDARLEASLLRDRLVARGITDASQWALVARVTQQANSLCAMVGGPLRQNQAPAVIVQASRKGPSAGPQPFVLPEILRDLPKHVWSAINFRFLLHIILITPPPPTT